MSTDFNESKLRFKLPQKCHLQCQNICPCDIDKSKTYYLAVFIDNFGGFLLLIHDYSSLIMVSELPDWRRSVR